MGFFFLCCRGTVRSYKSEERKLAGSCDFEERKIVRSFSCVVKYVPFQ